MRFLPCVVDDACPDRSKDADVATKGVARVECYAFIMYIYIFLCVNVNVVNCQMYVGVVITMVR